MGFEHETMDYNTGIFNRSATLEYEKTGTQYNNEATVFKATQPSRANECTYLR
jgi:hypothetical protein